MRSTFGGGFVRPQRARPKVVARCAGDRRARRSRSAYPPPWAADRAQRGPRGWAINYGRMGVQPSQDAPWRSARISASGSIYIACKAIPRRSLWPIYKLLLRHRPRPYRFSIPQALYADIANKNTELTVYIQAQKYIGTIYLEIDARHTTCVGRTHHTSERLRPGPYISPARAIQRCPPRTIYKLFFCDMPQPYRFLHN